MNFTYFFINDPNNEEMRGNISWVIPNFNVVSHWIHAEGFCKRENLFLLFFYVQF